MSIAYSELHYFDKSLAPSVS